jgi:hypothetical protein
VKEFIRHVYRLRTGHVKLVALLAGAHDCPKDQALGNRGEPEKHYQLCRVPRSKGLNGHGRTQKKNKAFFLSPDAMGKLRVLIKCQLFIFDNFFKLGVYTPFTW